MSEMENVLDLLTAQARAADEQQEQANALVLRKLRAEAEAAEAIAEREKLILAAYREAYSKDRGVLS